MMEFDKFFRMLASRTGAGTPTRRGRRREREATCCNSMELSGMDSTLPHLKELTGKLIGPLMDACLPCKECRPFLVSGHPDFKSDSGVLTSDPGPSTCAAAQ